MRARAFRLIGIVCLIAAMSWYVCRSVPVSPVQSKGPAGTTPADAAPTNPGQAPVTRADDLSAALNKGGGYAARLKAINSLPNNLDEQDRARILALVEDRAEHPTLRNDAVVLLCRQQVKDPTLADRLMTMYRDDQESDTWKDYSLQHLAPTFDYSLSREKVFELLRDEAERRSDSFSGTAMITLQRIGADHPHLKEVVQQIAARKNTSSIANNESEITAIQIAREAKDVSVLLKCRKAAIDADLKTRLRMSAIAAIAEIGQERDMNLLKRLSGNSDRRIARAASLGLRTMQKRFN